VTGWVPRTAGRIDWAAAESHLGTPLPSDYKELVGAFGKGMFDGFHCVFMPDDPVESTELAARLGQAPGEPHPPFPAPGGLVPWMGNEHEQSFHWTTEGADPDRWPLYVSGVAPETGDRFDCTATEYLFRRLTDPQHPIPMLVCPWISARTGSWTAPGTWSWALWRNPDRRLPPRRQGAAPRVGGAAPRPPRRRSIRSSCRCRSRRSLSPRAVRGRYPGPCTFPTTASSPLGAHGVLDRCGSATDVPGWRPYRPQPRPGRTASGGDDGTGEATAGPCAQEHADALARRGLPPPLVRQLAPVDRRKRSRPNRGERSSRGAGRTGGAVRPAPPGNRSHRRNTRRSTGELAG
jgi:hypothetical protein